MSTPSAQRLAKAQSRNSFTMSTFFTIGSTTLDSTRLQGNAQTNNFGRGGLGNDNIKGK
jgi:hypothetical protein